MIIAKKTWVELRNYKLNTVADHLQINFRHHDAKEDAMACAQIAISACKHHNCKTIDELANTIQMRNGSLYPDGYIPAKMNSPSTTRLRNIVPTQCNFDPSHLFYKKNVVFTGSLQTMSQMTAIQKVVDLGGFCERDVSRTTNFLVVGKRERFKYKSSNKSCNLELAEKMIVEGKDIKLLFEDKFLQLLNETKPNIGGSLINMVAPKH
jgi:DNA polymerase III subunit epsilon